MDVVALEKTEVYQGRYRVERTLGAGGMGVVYLAEDVKLGRKVAIKQLRSDMTGNSAEARFRSEAQLLARLNHPNIVRLYDVLEDDDSVSLVMELVEGVTLKEWLRENSAALAQKLDLLMQICQGLSEAHCLGIIHRDLKPDNILVTNDGLAKITDFGIAKTLDCDQQLTREDHIAGSIQAMSPEQLQGAKLDARSDLFSFGSIAYELLCGSKPFERDGMNALAFAQQISSKPHIPPQQSWPEIPKPLAALLDRLLEKNPELRPESAQQVFEALTLVRQYGIDTSTQQYSETVTQLLVKPRKKRGRMLAALSGIALAGVGAFWGWHSFMQLAPQYIAVLPVQLHGKVRGEENAETLVTAMVRQALMNTPSQLKSSALVTYTPEKGAPLEKQLRRLRTQGITDALQARLDCMQVRCSIELQRINPRDSQVRQQASFVFLTDKRQEAQYTITNNATELFGKDYQGEPSEYKRMIAEDYNRYLTILTKADSTTSEAVSRSDLDTLKELIASYPQNINLYLLYAEAATDLFLTINDNKLLTDALGVLRNAEETYISQADLLEAKLLIKSFSGNKIGFQSTLKELQAKGHPSAHLLAQFARFQFTQGNYQQGLTYAKEATALHPSAGNLYLIAMNQTAMGNYENARKTVSELINRFPEHWSAHSLKGVIELETGNLNNAEKAITSIPKEFRSWGAKNNLSTAYFLQGKYDQALELYQEVLTQSPDNLTVISNIAEAFLMLDRPELAKAEYAKIVQLTSSNQDTESAANALRVRAIALANLGQQSEAIALITKLLLSSPDDTDIKYSAALIYTLSGEWRSANYYIEELLHQDMSTEWFVLPVFKTLCTQPQASEEVVAGICL
ncbi:serine/threonine-protein kinase [Microbulbifer sp. GL-2]|uniref:protein kinase domain-containing protein n=1 Tax=Microbulbifer sp. GL-2 TaxID=2591606 RepID=UPI001164A811|nr:serine/threonine-protein kinase [Microbulbifer sp. GL-2]BBM01896.1 hypothetical protein GL2_19700 [Microbulbifer sp. GL-2]